MAELTISLILVLIYALQFCYFLVFIKPFLQYKDTIFDLEPQKKLVYFLISIKNESHQLYSFLKSLTEQNVTNTKIVLVSDHSDEDDWIKTRAIVSKFPLVKLLKSDDVPGKKNALRLGLKELDSGKLLLTDADCRPASSEWASIMSRKLDNCEVVLGYGPFYKAKGWINKLIRFDCMWIAAQYFGWSQKKMPYMAVGRNLAVRRETYRSHITNMKGDKIMSGDDDLFIQSLASNVNIDIAINKASYMFSKAEERYSSLLRQKTRQIQTSGYYKFRDQVILSLVAIVSILTVPLLVIAFFTTNFWIFSALMLTKILMSYSMFVPVAKKLHEDDLILFIPLLELLYGVHLAILGVYSLLSRKNKWK